MSGQADLGISLVEPLQFGVIILYNVSFLFWVCVNVIFRRHLGKGNVHGTLFFDQSEIQSVVSFGT